MRRIHVGTSGWQYADWRGTFYPRALPPAQWLLHYAGHFDTVEVNNTFYRLPSRGVFESWRASTPSHFVFAVKLSRYLTHVRRLRDASDPVAHFLEAARGLRGRLGPVLMQLPPTMRVDLDCLVAALRCFPRRQRIAVELRHPSWFTDPVKQALGDVGAALVLSDRLGKFQQPEWFTADWTFIRLHGGRGARGNYGRQALATWAQRLSAYPAEDAFVFFNNDSRGNAPRNAQALERLLSDTR